jgi:hypothetical protein
VLCIKGWIRILVAGTVGGLGGLITLALCISTPILIMDVIHGSQKVEDSPGGGGGLVIGGFMIGSLLSLAVFIFLAYSVYHRLPRSHTKRYRLYGLMSTPDGRQCGK